MSVYLVNGEISDQVPITDRGLQYGDGVFETLTVIEGNPQLWDAHMQRLLAGCKRLHIPEPDLELIRQEVQRLLTNNSSPSKQIIKIIITRGSGQRGYRPPDPVLPTRIIALLPFPDYPNNYWTAGVKITICKTRLACNRRLAGIKHLNRLEQVLAHTEWDDPEIIDGIMLNNDQYVIEGTTSNLFWVNQGQIYAPDLSECGVEGVMRNHVIKLAKELQLSTNIGHYFIEDLMAADEIFLTNSVHGIWPVRQVDEYKLQPGPITQKLMSALPMQV